MEETGNQVLFELPIEMELRKSVGGDRRIVRGYASTESMDQDGEVILQSGIDFGPLLKSGYLNYDHNAKCLACGHIHALPKCPSCGVVKGAKMPIIIGYPTRAEIRDKGLWVEGELLKSSGETTSEQTRMADEMWELGLAFQKSGGKRALAYSVEGGVLQRKGNRIVKSVVCNLAITHKPVNEDATIELFRKSFCCGKCSPAHPLYTPGHSCGGHGPIDTNALAELNKAMSTTSAGPLMLENLDRGMSSVLYGDNTTCGCFDTAGKFHDGLTGAVKHLQKCQGYTKDQSINFLRKTIHGSQHRPDLAVLVKAAGILHKP
jgi:hypothetical protein